MKSQSTKNIVITGGNNGIGFFTAKGLFQDGHNIIIGSRNQEKNISAVRQIMDSKTSKENTIKSFKLDLSKRKSIEQFAKYVQKQFKNVDILINNAGLILNQLEISELGFEMTMTINHFGPFYLTYLLFPIIKISAQARIINLSSMAHYSSPDNITHDLAMQQTSFSSLTQYNKSKLANVEFTVALADRLSKYPNIKTASLHPGIVSSGFGQNSNLIKCFRCFCCCLFVQSPDGARCSLHLARCPFKNISSGSYYNDNTEIKEMNAIAKDKSETEKLWNLSEKAYSIQFKI